MKAGSPMRKPDWTIAFDADDTLWHNERDFALTHDRFAQMLADYVAPEELQTRLLAAERRNLGLYGFGVKGYILSSIETAIEVTEGGVGADIIGDLMAMGRKMLAEPVEVFAGARAAIEALRPHAEVILITKGDLIDQERKLAQSGLGDLFDAVEIVSDKTTDVYSRIFARHDTPHQMMVGNSLKSDVIPAIKAGAWGVYVPHGLTWDYERAQAPFSHRHFRQIASLADLPGLLTNLT